MKKLSLILATACFISLVAFNSLWAFELITRDVIEKEIITEVDLIKTADNFIIVLEGSSQTNKNVPGTDIPKIAAAKALLQDRNQWLPDLGYNCGLYLISGRGVLKTIQPMKRYDRDAFGGAIDQLPEKGKGNAYFQVVLEQLEKIIDPLSGRTAVILITSGSYTDFDYQESQVLVQMAKNIAAKHDVRFYVISSAESDAQEELLERVASINAGSRLIPIQAFLEYPAYLSGALFTVKTSSYVKLTTRPELVGIVAQDMLFDFASDTIRSAYIQKLNRLGRFLKENPQAYVVAQGHTDSIGGKEYNLALSAERALGVGEYLVREFDIDPMRIVSFWYGDQNPAADNGSAEGRQLNRRVEIAIGGLN